MFARVVFESSLHSDLELATGRYEHAQLEFAAAISLPGSNPDRTRRIKRTAEIEASARNELWLARERVGGFNRHGITSQAEPESLISLRQNEPYSKTMKGVRDGL